MACIDLSFLWILIRVQEYTWVIIIIMMAKHLLTACCMPSTLLNSPKWQNLHLTGEKMEAWHGEASSPSGSRRHWQSSVLNPGLSKPSQCHVSNQAEHWKVRQKRFPALIAHPTWRCLPLPPSSGSQVFALTYNNPGFQGGGRQHIRKHFEINQINKYLLSTMLGILGTINKISSQTLRSLHSRKGFYNKCAK